MKVRYIRESMNGSNANSGCHWCEIQAIDYEGVNVALNKTVTCEGGTSEKGTLDMITNGNTTVDDYIYFRNDAQNTISVTIDLENVEELDNIRVWHYYGGGRTYHNILLETSLDGIKWVEVFNSNKNGEYVEVEAGKTHKLKDDRLPLLNENSSLNEVTSFYEKYIKQDISNKEFLKNVLTSKEIECNDDKMLNLINKVGSIATGKKWASGTATSGSGSIAFNQPGGNTQTHGYITISKTNINFIPKLIIVINRYSSTEVGGYDYYSIYDGYSTIYANGVVRSVPFLNHSYGEVNTHTFKADDRIITSDSYRIPVSPFSRNFEWYAFE